MNAEQKRKLQALRMNEGGVTFVTKKTRGSTDPAVVVSLGGFGGLTLNTLRAKVNRSLVREHHHQFLAIDTSNLDLESISLAKSKNGTGHLRDDEMISMLDKSTTEVLVGNARPDYMKKWLDDASLTGIRLDDSGAQQTRQVARVMLSSGDTYQKIRSVLQGKINAAKDAIHNAGDQGQINMILIAGIAGGTGSGTVVDIAYMIRDIMRDVAWTAYNLSAYLFLPDALYSVITDSVIRQNLRRNGYAALKEIDYFMNLENYKGSYQFSYLHGSITSSQNIFDSCNMISGYEDKGGIKKQEEIIDGVTDNILELLSDIRAAGEQTARAFLSNKRSIVQAWLQQVSSNPDYPQLANYGYNIIGYSSITIPKDEIMTYCANLVFQKVYEEFTNLAMVEDEMVDELLEKAELQTIDAAIERICAAAGIVVTEDEVLGGQLPTKREIAAGEDRTCDMFLNYVDAVMVRSDLKDGSFAERMTAQMCGILKEQLYEAFQKMGPFFALRVIRAEKKRDGCSGILERLENYLSPTTQKNLEAYYAEEMKRAQQTAAESAQLVKKKMFGADREIRNYLADCEAVGQLYFEQQMTVDPKKNSLVQSVLMEVYRELVEENNRIYRVYTEVLEELGRILAVDASYASDVSRSRTDGTGELFSFSVVNLYQENERTQRLKNYLEGFVSEENVNRLAEQFIQDMREHRQEWVGEGGEFHAADRIRELFDSFFEEQLSVDTIEKFLAVAYSQKTLSIQELEELWQSEADKERILKSAAKDIVNYLVGNAGIMAKTNGHAAYSLSKFICQQSIGLLSSVSAEFNRYLRDEITGRGLGMVTISDMGGSESRITFSKLYIGVPVYALRDMQMLDANYEDCIHADGLHMDEVEEDWRRFPQPYLREAAQVIDPTYQNRRDSGILEEVRERLAFCIACSAVELGPKSYVLHAIRRMPANRTQLCEQLYQAVLEDPELTVAAFLKQQQSEGVVELEEIPLMINEKTNVHYLEQEETAKVVRQSIYLMDHVLQAAQEYTELYRQYQKGIADGEVLSRAASKRLLFVNAIKTAVIVRQEDERWGAPIWYYKLARNEKLADLTRRMEEQVHYHLYCAFSQFCKLPERVTEQIDKAMNQHADEGILISREEQQELYEECERIVSELDSVYDYERFNKEMGKQFTGEYLLDVAMDKEDFKDAFRTLKGFYEVMCKSFRMGR